MTNETRSQSETAFPLSPSRRGKRFTRGTKSKNNRPLRNKRGAISRLYYRQTLPTPIRDKDGKQIGTEMRTVIFTNPKRIQEPAQATQQS
jgi:hypothetical protein